MAYFFRVMGRLTGLVLRSHVVDKTLTKAAGYALSEMRLADIRLKLKLLRKKRTRHLRLLGKTVYRLTLNSIDPFKSNHLQTITNVLQDIELEIEHVTTDLERRKQHEKQKSAQ